MSATIADMSLTGATPAAPARDQPKDIEIRLMVRPGITGWAQVNGGMLLAADGKSPMTR
jgi:lipopolysaccharide/colanic/teichoic acid biosynthesis glycosyltransferase